MQEVQGKGYLSKAADTYSLGVLLWEMFHGMPPYAAENGHLVNNTSFPRFDLRHREDAPFSYVVVALACLSEDFEKRCVLHCRGVPMLQTSTHAKATCDGCLAVSHSPAC